MHPRRPKPARPSPPPREPVETVYGLRAALAVFARRRDAIVSVAWTPEVRAPAAELIRWAGAEQRPARELGDADLAQRAGSAHHEGLCVQARARPWASPAELADALVAAQGTAVALDRVRNPYNIGTILRSAAFFGLDAALLGAPAPHPALAPDAVRVAEGGAEHLMLSRTTDPADTLARLRARGVRVIGAESDGRASAIGFDFAGPVVLVLGHEREGLSERVRAQCDALVAIRGSGAVDSLNVGVAAGVLIAELVRARPMRSPTSAAGVPVARPKEPRAPPPRDAPGPARDGLRGRRPR
jgi:TrmH RNA methyltransferase